MKKLTIQQQLRKANKIIKEKDKMIAEQQQVIYQNQDYEYLVQQAQKKIKELEKRLNDNINSNTEKSIRIHDLESTLRLILKLGVQ